jgi:DNA-binding NtrC family response regulator
MFRCHRYDGTAKEHIMQDGKHVILCIDDDEDIRMVLRTLLEANGYAVVNGPHVRKKA